MNRRNVLLGSLTVVAIGVTGISVTGIADSDDASGSDLAVESSVGTATARVTRGDLAESREFRAAVNFGDAWALDTTVTGTVTHSHTVGTVVSNGEELVRVDDKPVFLAAGDMPMFRSLHKVDTRARDENGKKLQLQRGDDVKQLQDFLLAAGHDAGETLQADGIFGSSTEKAVKSWQEAVGLSVTGRVDSSQVVFGPAQLRISESVRVGSVFQSLQVTEAGARVLVDTNNRDRSVLAPDTDVAVVLGDGTRVDGRSQQQEQATGADGSPIWRTTIETSQSLPSEASSAIVEVTDVAAEDSLLVPASALLALAEGGFAVEKIADTGSELIAVTVEEVLDGQAAVTADLSVDDEVVVPT